MVEYEALNTSLMLIVKLVSSSMKLFPIVLLNNAMWSMMLHNVVFVYITWITSSSRYITIAPFIIATIQQYMYYTCKYAPMHMIWWWHNCNWTFACFIVHHVMWLDNIVVLVTKHDKIIHYLKVFLLRKSG